MKPIIPALAGTILFLILVYYLLPPLFLQTDGPIWFLLLVINPLACIVSGFVFGLICGIQKTAILHPIIAALAFVPTLFIYYNDSALVYLAFYVITSVMGVAVGWIIYLKK